MRADVKEIIKPRQEAAANNAGDKFEFQAYAKREEVGKKILASLLKQTVEHKGRRVFFTDSREKDAGYLSDIYGCTGVFSLIARMNVTLNEEETENLVSNIYYIMDEIDKYGYTLAPYLSDEENMATDGRRLFGGNNYPYTGAMTWALSFFISVRKAERSGIIKLQPRYSRAVVENIGDIIENFLGSVIRKDGKAVGWAYTKGCLVPNIFFSYSVLEAYSDFEDNIGVVREDDESIAGLSENDVTYQSTVIEDLELIEAINKRRAEGEPEIQIAWRNACYEVADKVWEVYKDVLKDKFIDDTFLFNFHTVDRDDIVKSNSSNALFNTLYVVYILFYGYVNVRNKDGDEVVMTMNAALQNVQRVYDQLRKIGIEYIVDTYIIPFKSPHVERGDEYLKKLNYKMMNDTTILPSLVKANNVMAYHISRYPVKEISALFDELFDYMTPGEWVWDHRRYDVKITERYIEAIADFFDYYDRYERDYADAVESDKEREYALYRRVKKRVEEAKEAEVTERLTAQHEAELAARVGAVRAEYTLENAFREKVIVWVEAWLGSTLDRLVAKNNGEDVALSAFEAKLHDALLKVAESYFLAAARESVADENAFAHFAENYGKDLTLFISKWVEALDGDGEAISKWFDKK